MHASWDAIHLEEPNLGAQSVGKVLFPNTLFDLKRPAVKGLRAASAATFRLEVCRPDILKVS